MSNAKIVNGFDGVQGGKSSPPDQSISVEVPELANSALDTDVMLEEQGRGATGIEPLHYHRCSKAHGRVIASTMHPFTYELEPNSTSVTAPQDNGEPRSKPPLGISKASAPSPKSLYTPSVVNLEVSPGEDSRAAPGSAAVCHEPYPYPKWPANHKSAAFESVAVKKSFILSPPEIYAECAHHGDEKAKYQWYKMLMLTVIAGCYVGFGFTLCLQVGGNLETNFAAVSSCDPKSKNGRVCPPVEPVSLGLFKLIFGAFGFPFGFTVIVVCGAELYTSLCAYMAAAFWEGKVSIWTCLRVWVFSWCGNFIGCLIFVGLMKASKVYEGKEAYALYLARDKVSHDWGVTLVKGIFANWLVGIATWMANAAQDLTGKAVGIFLPISAFAAIGFEHCIANQFLIPMAIALGAPITAKQFLWHNLVPATIGNWIGGAVCLSTVYAFTYGRPPLIIKARIAQWRLKRRLK